MITFHNSQNALQSCSASYALITQMFPNRVHNPAAF